jgi:uncharacterized MAPEG superfamily protein
VNVPLLCLPVALVLVYAPRVVVARAMAQLPEGYDNADPRAQQAQLTGAGRRAAGAHANGFESFAPFAAGVLACEVTHARPGIAAGLAIVYVVMRALYSIFYIQNVVKLRSLVWFVGFLATFGLFGLPLVP